MLRDKPSINADADQLWSVVVSVEDSGLSFFLSPCQLSSAEFVGTQRQCMNWICKVSKV